MALELRLNQKLDLQLKLAPQIIQSIEILQLPSVDLQSLIDLELDTNEFLELKPPETESLDGVEGDSTEAPGESEGSGDEAELKGREAELSQLEAAGNWDEEIPRYKSVINHEAADRKQDAMNNTADRGPSLQDFILEQFGVMELDPEYREIGKTMIGFINRQGRFEGDFEVILEEYPEFDLDDAAYVLDCIQSLEPRGIAARDTKECLLLQLNPKTDAQYELKRRLISDFLEDLARNRRPKIAKALGLDYDELDELVAELAELDYQPGRTAVDDEPHYIYPDILVEWSAQGYEVKLANDKMPGLKVNKKDAEEVLSNSEVPTVYKEEVRKQIDSASWLVSAIAQRNDTLMRVATRIVTYQQDFLEFGPHYLRPLKMQQIADDLGIHVSTVSRATNEKYMQTHRGIFSMKSFFTGATTSTDGSVESRSSVRQRVKEIVNAEDKKKPLSDEAIVKKLRENFGIEVARRTITKYRKALDIPSTRQRRTY